MEYKSVISPKMRAVEELLFEEFAGMSHCIVESGRNLIVEVPKYLCEEVRMTLKRQFQDVALMRNAYLIIEDLHDFILIKPIISESPLYVEEGVSVPELEKILVDHDSDKEYAFFSDDDIQMEFQRAFELYPVNTSRLLRYAGRKGKKEEILGRVQRIDKGRIDLVRTIQEYFTNEPVTRAWLFGSFSRMEETPRSDIDILVDLDKSVPLGLLHYARMARSLEDKLGRKVDLVANGSIKPFASESINRDKVLIYERA